jgi:hypothetical protein
MINAERICPGEFSFNFPSISVAFRQVRTEEAIQDVREAFAANPHLSTRRNPFVSTGDTDSDEDDHGTVRMSRGSLQRILKEVRPTLRAFNNFF